MMPCNHRHGCKQLEGHAAPEPGELWHVGFVERERILRPVVEHDLSHARRRRQLVAGQEMLDVVDQGVEVRAGIRAEADHEVVKRPEGHCAPGGATTVEPNAEADLLQFAGKRVVLSSMQAVLDRGGFETYDRGLTLLWRRLIPDPRGPVLGRLDF